MAPRPDDPTLDPGRACAAIEAACPELRPASVTSLGRGWDHDVYLANSRWVFRFPRNETAATNLLTDVKLLPWIAERVPLPVPQPALAGVLAATGWRFARHQLIPGTTICDAELDADTRARLAVPLAHFVRELHALAASQLPIALSGDPFGRLDVARRVPRALERFAAWRDTGVLPAGVCRVLAKGLESVPPRPLRDASVLVHSDLHPRNVLVDANGFLSGVIDWVDVHIGHREIDLSAAFEILPARARDAFFANCGPCDATAIAWARWRGIEKTSSTFAGAIERQDVAFTRSTRQALIEMADG